jgi:hypothetical protein
MNSNTNAAISGVNNHHMNHSSHNGVSSVRSSGSNNGISAGPSTVSPSYGGAMAYERPLPSVSTHHYQQPHHSSSSSHQSHHHHSPAAPHTTHVSHTSSLPSASTSMTPSTSHTLANHQSTTSTHGNSGVSGSSIVISSSSVMSASVVATLPPVAGATGAPTVGSNGIDDGTGSGSGGGIGLTDDEKMMESKVTEEVLRMRNHLKSLTTLSKRTFAIGATLGTGTFGRVRLCSYTPPPSAVTAVNGVNAALRQNWYALKMLKKSEIIRLKQGNTNPNHPFFAYHY